MRVAATDRSVGVELDPVAVGVGDLDAHEPAVVLPFGLDDAGRAKTLSRRPRRMIVGQAKAEVVGARQLASHRRSLRERQLRTVVRAKDQEMFVGVDSLRQPEVRAIERGGPLSIADGERNVVERHPPIMPSPSAGQPGGFEADRFERRRRHHARLPAAANCSEVSQPGLPSCLLGCR